MKWNQHLANLNYLQTSILFILLGIFSIAYAHEEKIMFNNKIIITSPNRQKNLDQSHFAERNDIQNIIDELNNSTKDAYAASLPLIASAELGDQSRYIIMLAKMLEQLEVLDKSSEKNWMQNNSFKAWMWGRILLAADSMNDIATVNKAKDVLKELLKADLTPQDNFAFYTWAWGYRAALDQKQYANSKKRMLNDAVTLTEKYNLSRDDAMLSDALWAWVMNLQAAAFAEDQETYQWIKEQIKIVCGKETVTAALEEGLLRTLESNDYPAWAMAKIRYAAIVMNDHELYQEIESALTASLDGAKNGNAQAEYALAVLDNQLAIEAAQKLKVRYQYS